MKKMEISASFSSRCESRDRVPQMQADVVQSHIAAAIKQPLAHTHTQMLNGNFNHFNPVLDESKMLLFIRRHDR